MDTTSEISPSQPAQQNQFFPVEFRGNGLEYTKLVLVNLALSIITFGIFSAWAKVRTRKYVYGNLYINGSNFNYHADPIQILKGRLIIGALFVCMVYGQHLSIVLSIVAGLIFVIAMPWLIVRGMSFNNSNTSYRNIRFGFDKKYAESYKTIYLGYLVTIFTAGLGAPFFYQSFMQFRTNNSRYGATNFRGSFTVGEFYTPFFKYIGIIILSLIGGGVIFGSAMIIGKTSILASLLMFPTFVVFYGGILMAIAVFNADIFNIVYRNTRIENIRMQASMRGWSLAKIYMGNIFIGAFTFGFGLPYCMFRIMKYKSQNVALWTTPEQFEQFIASKSTDDSGAVADAAGDFWDIDIGF